MEFIPGELEFFFSTLVFYETGTGDVLYAYYLGDENPNGVEISLGSIIKQRHRIMMDVRTPSGLTEFLVYIIDHESIHWALRLNDEAIDYENEEEMVDWAMRTFFVPPFGPVTHRGGSP